jgi:hypothetical protein
MALAVFLVYLAVQNGNPEVRVVPDPAAVEAIHSQAVTGPERSTTTIFPRVPSRVRLPKCRWSWWACNIKNRQPDLFNMDRGGMELPEWEFAVFDLG